MHAGFSFFFSTVGRFLVIGFVLGGLFLSGGCGSKKPDREDMADIYAAEALKDFRHGNYHDALETFQKIRDQYPFSKHSLLAELKIADCNYHIGKFDEALARYEEFEQNHPTNEAVPYVLFQIGMSHFKMLDTIDRDTSGAHNAIQAFTRLLKSYPVSPYTEEAKVKIASAKDFLARHEMYVASFYMRTKEREQAERRLQYILDIYPGSSVAAKAKRMLDELQGKPTTANQESLNGDQAD